jgi:hypothetical protein
MIFKQRLARVFDDNFDTWQGKNVVDRTIIGHVSSRRIKRRMLTNSTRNAVPCGVCSTRSQAVPLRVRKIEI